MAESGQTPNETNAVYDVERGTYRRIFNESTVTIGMKGAEADRALFDTAPLQSARREMELNNDAVETVQALKEEIALQDTAVEMKTAEIEEIATQTADIEDIQPQNRADASIQTPEQKTAAIEALSPIFEAKAGEPNERALRAENDVDRIYDESQHGHEALRRLNAMETLAERMGTDGPVNNSLRGGQERAEQKEKERTSQAIRYAQYIRQLEENVRQNQLAVEEAQKRVDEANKRVAEAEQQVERAEENVAKAEVRVETLTEELVVLDQKIDQNQQEQAALRTQEAEQVAKIEVLEEQQADTEQEIKQIDAKTAVLETKIAANDDAIVANQQAAEQHAAVAEQAEAEKDVVAQDNTEVARRLNALEANAPTNPETGEKLFVNAKGDVVNQDGQKQDISKDQLDNPNALTSFEKYESMQTKKEVLAEKFNDKDAQASEAKDAAVQAQEAAEEKTAENAHLENKRADLKEMRAYYDEGLQGLKKEIRGLGRELKVTREALKDKIDEGKDLVAEKERKVEELGIAKGDLANAKEELLEAKDNLSARQKEQLEAIQSLEAAQKKLDDSKQELRNAQKDNRSEMKEMGAYRSWLKDDDTREKILKGEITREEILDKTPESLRAYVTQEMDKGREKFAQRDAVGIEKEQQVASVSVEQTATSRIGTSAAKSDINTGTDMSSAFASAASPNQPTAATPQQPGADMDMTEQTRRAAMSGQTMSMGMA
ncbi:hypothetical protein [Micavibrio aeruginosavorus]|uniref:hypothetical protein n=1 Tax=Micavibrio aeruginosavorus TaxID=349221 RepID=UPI003F4A8FBF